MNDDNALTVLRKQLLANGYSPLPGLDKGCKMETWNSTFLKNQAKRYGSLDKAIETWPARLPEYRTTNVRIENRLVPIDGDVNDPVLAARLAGVLKDVVPDAYERAPARYGSGTHKVTWFCRLADGEAPFIRRGSRKYVKEGEKGYHHVEIFGGEPFKSGNCSRQFGVFGPHTVGSETEAEILYEWADGVSLADVPLAELPEITGDQVWEIAHRFEKAAEEEGWTAQQAEGAGAEGVTLFDIDRATTRFQTKDQDWISYAELEEMVASGDEPRLWATFIPEEVNKTESSDRCQARWSDKYQCTMVYDYKLNNTHVPIDKKPDPGLNKLASVIRNLKERGPPAPAVSPPEVEKEADSAGEPIGSPADGAFSGVVTQDAVALRFAEIYQDSMRFCHHAGAWYEWDGLRWRKDERARAFQFSRGLARAASRGLNKSDLKEARKMSFAAGVERGAKGDERLAVTSEQWDRDPFLIGTPEGTLDLRTGRVREPEPGEGITKLTALAPLQGLPTPIWDRFLGETFGGDRELIRFNQQWFGYCMTGDTREHALWFGFGNGGNGKGVLLNTIAQIMGDYARTAPMETFTAKKVDSHPTEIAMLRGARMVSASETEEGRAWAESRIKQITGGDAVSARFMHKDFFEFWPTFKLVLIGNHKPILRNVDAAVRRRFKLVPFLNDVPLDKQDRQLTEKLRGEWAGIMQWMVEGCLDWQANGLIVPAAVAEVTEGYFAEQDTMGQWLAEACERHLGAITATATLFGSWLAFSQAAGEPLVSRKAFTMELARRGFEAKRTETTRNTVGLRLKKPGGKHLYVVPAAPEPSESG